MTTDSTYSEAPSQAYTVYSSHYKYPEMHETIGFQVGDHVLINSDCSYSSRTGKIIELNKALAGHARVELHHPTLGSAKNSGTFCWIKLYDLEANLTRRDVTITDLAGRKTLDSFSR